MASPRAPTSTSTQVAVNAGIAGPLQGPTPRTDDRPTAVVRIIQESAGGNQEAALGQASGCRKQDSRLWRALILAQGCILIPASCFLSSVSLPGEFGVPTEHARIHVRSRRAPPR